MFAVVVFGFALAGAKLDINWKDCGDSTFHGHVQNLTVTPNPAELGKPFTVVGTGSSDEQLSGGSWELVVNALGKKVLDTTKDLCGDSEIDLPLMMGKVKIHGVSCPHAKGPLTPTIDVSLSSFVPKTAVEVQVTAKDQSKANLLCVSVNVTPEKANAEEQVENDVDTLLV
jgi:hypothetical protein